MEVWVRVGARVRVSARVRARVRVRVSARVRVRVRACRPVSPVCPARCVYCSCIADITSLSSIQLQ